MIGSNNAQAYISKEFTAQRGLFLRVESDLKKGKLVSYNKHKQELLNYPLYPYLRYEILKSSINTVKHSEISAFIKTYHDSPLSTKLRNEWLRAKASKQLWEDFLKAYDTQANNNVEMQCHYINATLKTTKDKSVYKYLPKIWLQGKELPKSCDAVFSQWKQDGKLTRNLRWQRIKLSIIQNEHKLARHLAKSLTSEDEKIVELWIRTHNDPELIVKPHYFTVKHSAVSEMIVHAIVKIAKTNPQNAVKLWKLLEKKHDFNDQHWGLAVKEIGLALARKYDPHAEKWLDSIPANLDGKDVHDARLKLAVSKNAWSKIAKLYIDLPEEESQTEKWQYWYARSMEMLGDRKASQEILGTLAMGRTYYGFCASARILKPFAFNHEPSQIPKENINKLLLKAPIIRAHELKQIGRFHVGKTEWNKALEAMDDSQRLAAAHLATKWDMPNWAIVALSTGSNKNDLLLRFPRNYSDHIHKESKHNSLDPEILFAITRQESAFIPTARSPVGALGLMQIMPMTGKMLAKLNNESLHNHMDLLNPEKNIRLGSKYVRMMLDKCQQNLALAAASYNAGPHRVTKWLPEYDMPTDSWIETIPFKETREYVQNVLTYTVIYQQLLGKTPKLSKYMPIINGQKRNVKDKQ